MGRKTILVVEDNDDLRLLFASTLALSGFAVREVSDGMEALRLIDSSPPDAIVLDLGLPRVTGYDVLAELKQHASTREIPVVVVTGTNDPVDAVDADCLLRKPVEAAQLIETIQRCLASRQPPEAV